MIEASKQSHRMPTVSAKYITIALPLRPRNPELPSKLRHKFYRHVGRPSFFPAQTEMHPQIKAPRREGEKWIMIPFTVVSEDNNGLSVLPMLDDLRGCIDFAVVMVFEPLSALGLARFRYLPAT